MTAAVLSEAPFPALPSFRVPAGLARALLVLTAFSVAMCGEPEPVPAAPPSCPASTVGPTLDLPKACPAPTAGVLYTPSAHQVAERLRVEHAAMDAAGNLCLDALEAARAERNLCFERVALRLDGVGDLLAAQADGLEAFAQRAAAGSAPPPSRQPWVLVGVGGLVAGAAGVAAVAAEASTAEATGIVVGAALVSAGIAAAVHWVVGG